MAEPSSAPFRVLVAGGGVAGLEALLALRDLLGPRVELTLLTPESEFVYRPMAVAEPFARGRAKRHSLDEIARTLGASLVSDSLVEVDDASRSALTAGGDKLTYDALIVAVGADSAPAFQRVRTWTPEQDVEIYSGLLRDLEEGYSKTVAFVIPGGVAWPLPAYELALMTAWDAKDMGQDDVEITIYTHEEAPLGIFGPQASAALQEDLDEAGVRVVTGATVRQAEDGKLEIEQDKRPVDAQRVISLPEAAGRAIAGVPGDERGFVPTDRFGRVEGMASVWAAGDAIAYPIKQGGLAAQEADVVAQSIAAAAGADVEPKPFQPVLRGVLLTGRGSAWMRHELTDEDEGTASRHALFWPPTKIAGRYLSPFLASRDEAQGHGAAATPSGAPVELDLS
jgi:sulfide:quinone oxidoreductase